ncbi:hypothetical protein VTJ83DRAFT_2812 [Remersonia thermophila]|uniref:CBM21 domain-containing protein n=1 Tax=Remersonia thermophila TaxID=72144 RepID=A0ABR4DJS6_9PEZI
MRRPIEVHHLVLSKQAADRSQPKGSRSSSASLILASNRASTPSSSTSPLGRLLSHRFERTGQLARQRSGPGNKESAPATPRPSSLSPDSSRSRSLRAPLRFKYLHLSTRSINLWSLPSCVRQPNLRRHAIYTSPAVPGFVRTSITGRQPQRIFSYPTEWQWQRPPRPSSLCIVSLETAASSVSYSDRHGPALLRGLAGRRQGHTRWWQRSAISTSRHRRPQHADRCHHQLRDAISQIPEQRAPRPENPDDKTTTNAGDRDAPTSLKSGDGMRHSFSTTSLSELANGSQRRFTHARSATEPHISLKKSTSSSSAGSEEETDEEKLYKPQMVRKKSGELVRPALRPPSRRRPSSMPGTPTFSKVVHFDSHLEHVRHFLQVDRPLAVSAGSSPIDNYDSDTEYPFSGDERPARQSLPFEWELVMTKFPVQTPARKAQMVCLERVWLSNDQKLLIGSIAVANLAFHKFVACRFTLDYWKTTSEVAAEYVCEVRPAETPFGQDRFQFSIKLSDLANLELKTLYFCIRYSVNGQEYWDNNYGTNFQVDFRKKFLPQNGKKGAAGAASRPFGGLPKSNRGLSHKPKRTSNVDEDFAASDASTLSKSIQDYLGESRSHGVKLKPVKSAGDLPSDNLSVGISGPSGQFAQRYDFSSSLSRAIKSAKSDNAAKSEGLYMKSAKKLEPPAAVKTEAERGTQTTGAAPRAASTSSALPVAPLTDSPSAGISSATYNEIVSKWCFFESKKSTHSRNHTPSESGSSTASSTGSPVQMANYIHAHSGTQHHSLHPNDPTQYFSHGSASRQGGSSPAGTPPTPSSSPKPGRPAISPLPAGAEFGALASSTPSDYYYQHSRDRFPFYGPETYASAAIRG